MSLFNNYKNDEFLSLKFEFPKSILFPYKHLHPYGDENQNIFYALHNISKVSGVKCQVI